MYKIQFTKKTSKVFWTLDVFLVNFKIEFFSNLFIC